MASHLKDPAEERMKKEKYRRRIRNQYDISNTPGQMEKTVAICKHWLPGLARWRAPHRCGCPGAALHRSFFGLKMG